MMSTILTLEGHLLTLSAQVKVVNQPIPLNGDFSKGVWQDVPEQSAFVLLKKTGKTNPGAQTAFKVAADADNLYLNIRCYEPRMNELKKTDNPAGLWGSDLVEISSVPAASRTSITSSPQLPGICISTCFMGKRA